MNHMLNTLTPLIACAVLAGCDREPPASSPGSSAPAASARATHRARDDARVAVEQYLLEGRPREALVITTKLVEAEPAGAIEKELHARALLADAMLGPTEARAVGLDLAADAYRSAASLDPSSAALQHAAGVALDQSGRVRDALEHYRRAAAIDGTNPQYSLYAAMALRRLGETAEALRALDVAQRSAPDEPLIEVVRSDALLASGDPQGSLRAAQRARTLAPRDLEPRIAEARALRALDRAEEAAESLTALPHAARTNEAVAQELAESLLAIGRAEAAARAWEDSLEADPRRWRSAVGAAEAWIAAGDSIRANARLEHARALAPKEPRVLEAQAKLNAARRATAP